MFNRIRMFFDMWWYLLFHNDELPLKRDNRIQVRFKHEGFTRPTAPAQLMPAYFN